MGADLIVVMTVVRADRPRLTQEVLEKVVRDYVLALTPEHWEDDDLLNIMDEEADVSTVSKMQAEAIRAITFLVSNVDVWLIDYVVDRDTVFAPLGDGKYRLLITGGTSAGDDPGEAFTMLTTIYNLPGNTEPFEHALGLIGLHDLNVSVLDVPTFTSTGEADEWMETVK